jgi:hypothetical protein
LAVRCSTSALRDSKTVAQRFEHEGLSFLGITLADFGKAVQKWLDQGFVVPSDTPSFRRKRHTGLPAFLSGFLGRVFDSTSGVLLEHPDIEAIYAVRQLTLSFSKIALPESTRKGGSLHVTVERERLAIEEYLQCEKDVRESDALLDPQFLADFERMANLLFSDLMDLVDSDVYWGRLTPKHGPGAVADKLSSNAKWNLRTWTTRLERASMPASEFLYLNPREYLRGRCNELTILEPDAELPVKVVTVPKTLKAPRIIAEEPSWMQYSQQALSLSIRAAIQQDSFLSRIIGIEDQVPNQELARLGSLSGDLATLDLSEASDRVSNQHVMALFAGQPSLLAAIQACRSTKADVPGHGVIRLAKFASMGSALTFPIEGMVFTTMIFLGIESELSTPFSSRKELYPYADVVRVFGDDLIVPREHVLSVIDVLSTFGCKVNVDKSFWTGRFRESCGTEWYDGHDVGIVKVRRILPSSRQDVDGVIAAVSLRNLAYRAGLWQTAAWLDNLLIGILRYFPNVGPDSPLLGRESFLGYQFEGLDPSHHSPFAKGYKSVSKPPRDHLEGPGALLKCLSSKPWQFPHLERTSRSGQDLSVASVDDEHLERSGRPERVYIKLRRARPF